MLAQPIIARRVTHRDREARVVTAALSAWESADAYVLLGEPGSGKTEAMRAEADRVGGWYVTARDFVTLRTEPCEVVFIDGIDEMRATSPSHDGRLDEIRSRLQAIGSPKFRLSCREADWIASDTTHLAAVAPSREVKVLQLAPLDQTEQSELLGGASVLTDVAPDLEPLLGNPLLLKLIAKVIDEGKMPRSRSELYELSCRSLATEHNGAIRRQSPMTGEDLQALLQDAGLLCALLLMADRAGFTSDTPENAGSSVALESIPEALGIRDAPAALASTLFLELDGKRVPRHRTIAEYLAARAIAQRIKVKGVSVSRVLALTCGFDGRPSDPLRGLHAWLSVFCLPHRPILIARDPLGVVLYGDVRGFDPGSKALVFRGLQREAERFTWFRNGDWQQHPFGALGTRDMAPFLTDLLRRPERDPVHQVLLECALDAVRFGDPLPDLLGDLQRIVQDPTYWERNRLGALRAWMKQRQEDMAYARQLLDAVNDGIVEDRNDEIAGELLSQLYPSELTARAALDYFHPRKNQNLIGAFEMFWASEFVERMQSSELATIADDALPRLARFWEDDNVGHELRSLSGKLIARAVTEAGETARPDQLYAWLGAGIDRFGSARLEEVPTSAIAGWLSDHPDAQKAVIGYALTQIKPDLDGRVRTWRMIERLHRAKRPSDWYSWLLEQASHCTDPVVAKEVFEDAAVPVRNQFAGFDLTIEALEAWVARNAQRWPEAQAWLTEMLSCDLDAHQGRHHREERARKLKEAEQDAARRTQFAQYLDAIRDGSAPPGVLHQVAFAYDKRFYDIEGDTPEDRVAKLLGVDVQQARQCIQGIAHCIDRNDLPPVDKILELDLDSRYHLLRPPCLLGLRLRRKLGEDLAATLPAAKFDQLFAFALTDGLDDSKSWAVDMMALYPQGTAPVFLQYARGKISKNPDRSITGIWELRRDEREMNPEDGDPERSLAEFARLVVPDLLEAVPLRATEQHLNLLNRNLLPAALKHLTSPVLEQLLDARLARTSMAAAQRVCWLATGLSINPSKYLAAVVQAVGKNEKLAGALGSALSDQSTRSKNTSRLPVEPMATLVELLGPQTTPDWGIGGVVRDMDTRSDLVRGLVSQLASSTAPQAGVALRQLRIQPQLAHWKTHLDGALHDHVRVVRASSFVHASPEQVGNTLGNKRPSNVQDLVALVTDALTDLQEHIRHDNADMLNMFWRPDNDGTSVPRVENECRDVLLPLLRPELLKHDLLVDKEMVAANSKRADLRVSAVIDGKPVVLPVEIKKDNHRELYTAWRDQLARLYATDPNADHTGLYLVLWFNRKTRSTARGKCPASPVELLQHLNGLLGEDATGRMNFFVLDLSARD